MDNIFNFSLIYIVGIGIGIGIGTRNNIKKSVFFFDIQILTQTTTIGRRPT